MTPRTNSPPPPSYGSYDDDFNDIDAQGPSYHQYHPQQNYRSSQTHYDRAPTTTRSAAASRRPPINPATNPTLTNVLLRPLNLPRRLFTSSTVQALTLVVIYSFCLTTLWCIFCASFILTFYDDAKRLVSTSRAWAQVKNGVRERLSMMGEDWEEFAKKYFDQPTNLNAAGAKNGHLGATSHNGGNNSTNNYGGRNEEWEDWIRGMMFRFATMVVGQEASNRFQQTTNSFRFRSGDAPHQSDHSKR